MTTAASSSAFTREDVHFRSASDLCAAWLYRPTSGPMPCHSNPAQASTKYPALILASGLGGIKEMALDRYASRFVELGVVCIAFDYRRFGASTGQPRQLLNIQDQLDDYQAAIAYACQLEYVDEQRIGLWGTSFSGGHVISTAARDKRVKAVVAQCPFTSGWHSVRTAGVVPLIWLSLLGVRDVLFSGKDSVLPIKVAGKPGEGKSSPVRSLVVSCADILHRAWARSKQSR